VIPAQQALRQVVDAAAPLLEATEAVHMQELVAGASASELTASSQLVMLSQRLAYSAATIHTPKGLNPEAVFLLGKDLRSFQELLTALLDGNAELRLRPAKVAPLRAALLELRNRFSATRAQGEAFLGQLKNVVTAREAQAHLASDAAALGDALSQYCAGTRGNAAAR
jgi:twitching motility protein PilJ